jgi:glycosyltransferase involved in cell wall biosynthesis
LIVALNATAYDERPSGARTRTIGLAAALLRAGVSVRLYVPRGSSLRDEVVREFGDGFPGDYFDQIPTPLAPNVPWRRAFASRRKLDQRIPSDTDALVTDYYPVSRKVPTLLTVHDLRYFAARRHESAGRSAWFRAVFPRIARRAAGLVVPTNAVAAEARRFLGVEASRITVVPNGLSRAFRDADRSAGEGSHLVMIGFAERRKDFATILAALRLAPAVPPLVVVGRGRPPIGARALVAAGRVRFAGSRSDDAVAELARDAVALLHPSRYEGFGLPVIEAMSAGVPILAAREPAVEEVAGGFATLLPPGDADAWAAAITSVAPPPPAARDHAHSFTWDVAARRLMEAVTGVASRA